MSTPASDRLIEIFSTTPLKLLNWFQRNLTWSKISTSLPSLCFSGQSENQDGCSDLWLTFSTSPLKLLNKIQIILLRCQISASSTTFVFFGPIGKHCKHCFPCPSENQNIAALSNPPNKGGTLHSGERFGGPLDHLLNSACGQAILLVAV